MKACRFAVGTASTNPSMYAISILRSGCPVTGRVGWRNMRGASGLGRAVAGHLAAGVVEHPGRTVAIGEHRETVRPERFLRSHLDLARTFGQAHEDPLELRDRTGVDGDREAGRLPVRRIRAAALGAVRCHDHRVAE